jgi:transmembrane sensor
MQTQEANQSAENLIPGYLTGELTPDEIQALISWIKASHINKRYFDEYCEIWITAKASLKDPGYDFQEGFSKFKQKIRDKDESMGTIKMVSFKTFMRYAAIFIVAASLSGFLFYSLGKHQTIQGKLSYNELTVPLGSHARFTLSDGTIVTLNAGSSLKYDNRFGIKDRIVKLEGEGYFDVSKDSKRPFVVKTSYLNVRALGTIFNIKAYDEDKTIETTLVEGSVKIEEVKSKTRIKATILKPNQKLTYYKAGSVKVEESSVSKDKTENIDPRLQAQKSKSNSRITTESVDVEPIVSWKENRWIFEKQSLEQIAIELERKFDVQIDFETERLKAFRFTGTIIAEPIEQVLEVMSISAPIDYKLKGRVVTLSENRSFEKLNKTLYKQ